MAYKVHFKHKLSSGADGLLFCRDGETFNFDLMGR
jgi:hypothetical protein